MNIVIVTSDLLPDPGGIASHVSELIAAHVRAGHTVTVVHSPKNEADSAAYQERVRCQGAGYVDVRTRWRSRVLRVPTRLTGVARAVRTAGPSGSRVVHFHDLMNTTMASVLIRGRKVWTNHTSQFYSLSRAQRLICRITTRVDAVIAPSQELAILTRSYLGRRATFIPNGIDVSTVYRPRSMEAKSGHEFRVVIPRRMVHKNGVDVAVAAACRLGRPVRHGAWRLLVPCTGADAEFAREVKEHAALAPAHLSVEFLGEVDRASMLRVMETSDLALVPSRIEAVSIAALEALAVGCALVASDVGGLHDAFSRWDTVTLVPPEDPLALAEAIAATEARTAEDLARSSRTNAELVRAHFSWDEISERVRRLYASGS